MWVFGEAFNLRCIARSIAQAQRSRHKNWFADTEP